MTEAMTEVTPEGVEETTSAQIAATTTGTATAKTKGKATAEMTAEMTSGTIDEEIGAMTKEIGTSVSRKNMDSILTEL